MFSVYILYSKELLKFYVGHTSMSINERLDRHLSNHAGFTAKAKDWVVIYQEIFSTKSEAIHKELTIKKRGAKRFLQDNAIL